MKQVTKKTLGVAALGAAFAAAGGGVAAAGTGETVGAVTGTAAGAVESLPAENLAANLPEGTAETLGETQDVVRPAGTMTASVSDEVLSDGKSSGGQMLGGLPAGLGLPTLG